MILQFDGLQKRIVKFIRRNHQGPSNRETTSKKIHNITTSLIKNI